MSVQVKNKDSILFVLKCLLGSYIITGGLLLLLALLLYRFQLSEAIVSGAITGIYILTTFIAGLWAGKHMKSKKFVWGLVMGVLYFVVLLVVSLIINHSVKDIGTNLLTSFFLCAGSGTLGGMIS